MNGHTMKVGAQQQGSGGGKTIIHRERRGHRGVMSDEWTHHEGRGATAGIRGGKMIIHRERRGHRGVMSDEWTHHEGRGATAGIRGGKMIIHRERRGHRGVMSDEWTHHEGRGATALVRYRGRELHAVVYRKRQLAGQPLASHTIH
jgi:hypothetical protein